MDVTLQGHIVQGITSQPAANGVPPQQRRTDKVPPPWSDRPKESVVDEGLTDSPSTNDVAQLLPNQSQREKNAPPICAPPSFPPSPPPPPLPLPPPASSHSASCSLHRHHHRHHQSSQHKRLSSTRSHASFKADAAHIKEVAGDDCCVHCVLACLFCELWSMCTALGECLCCGGGGSGCCEATLGCCCCCCVEAAGEAACAEGACQAVLDCGIMEDCCGSDDCLEICLECCSICFPS